MGQRVGEIGLVNLAQDERPRDPLGLREPARFLRTERVHRSAHASRRGIAEAPAPAFDRLHGGFNERSPPSLTTARSQAGGANLTPALPKHRAPRAARS